MAQVSKNLQKLRMRNFLRLAVFCLALLVFSCGGGGNGDDDIVTGGTVENGRGAPQAVRSQVESRCSANSQSDFCAQAYAVIAQWVAGEISDEEFVDRIIAMRERNLPSAGGPSSEAEEPPEPIAIDVQYRCSLTDSLEEMAYDPAWEAQVNARERKVYTGTGNVRRVYFGDGAPRAVVENIRVYSYNPSGQSRENTERVLKKLMCKLVHDPDFHHVTLRPGQRDEDGEQVATLPSIGKPVGNVLLFFEEDEVSSLLSGYDGMTYSEIRQDIIINQDYVYLGYSRIPLWEYNYEDNMFDDFHSIAEYSLVDCEELRLRRRLLGEVCVPDSDTDYYLDWFDIWNDNRPCDYDDSCSS